MVSAPYFVFKYSAKIGKWTMMMLNRTQNLWPQVSRYKNGLGRRMSKTKRTGCMRYVGKGTCAGGVMHAVCGSMHAHLCGVWRDK
jgi:hypothetical protein